MLNKYQKQAVDIVDGPLLILAGAGAGKTHTLIERVASMIQDHGIAPESILCVTFTNKAAREMRDRLTQKLGVRIENNFNPYRIHGMPVAGTFHSIGVFFLRQFIDRIGYSKDFVIYDEDDKLKLIKQICSEKNIDEKEAPARQILFQISAAKNDGIRPENFEGRVHNYFTSIVRDVYADYEKAMKRNNALDFDDILFCMKKILEVPEVLAHFHAKFQYFLVDEYQDTNSIQYDIVRLLASASRNLCVVGDDWQGIYSWRGANIKNILHFHKDYPDATIVKLEQNYRSTKTIIEAANMVVKNNKSALDKTLWTENDRGELITLIDAYDEKHEADTITEIIRDSGTYSKWAILYRTNSQSRLLEEALMRKGIPYKIFGGLRFYERKEIKDMISYIRVLLNPFDTMGFSRIINTPSRKIGAKTVETLITYAKNYNMSIPEILANVGEIEEFTTAAKRSLADFSLLYSEFLSFSRENTITDTIGHISERIGYKAYLESEYGEEDGLAKFDNVRELQNMAERYGTLEAIEALRMFLEDIALLSEADNIENDATYVSLMTVHLSKGLEFENVIIAGAEEGLFPHSRSLLEQNEIEEERRLMYVAMTRAKQILYISRAKERYTFGNYSANPASRFLKEIPAELTKNHTIQVSNNFFGNFRQPSSNFGGYSVGEKLIPKEKKERPTIAAGSLGLGDRVRHEKFGIGTIVALSGVIADIAFPETGIKKMNLEIAPLVRQ